MMKKAFTLAEVLITLAIIGVVAALTIPSVIVNTQQQEFKTGLRKAISVLNSAITMNQALEGESPHDNKDLFLYLQQHMSVIHSTTNMGLRYKLGSNHAAGSTNNAAFYTTDGMRFEFYRANYDSMRTFPLYENPDVLACVGSTAPSVVYGASWTNTFAEQHEGDLAACHCGSYGLSDNPLTMDPPCIITVDVNGDRKPNPANAACQEGMSCAKNIYKYAQPGDKRLQDVFSIMITDEKAVPYGIIAQRAMYNSKNK